MKKFIAAKALIGYQGKILILRESGSYEEGTNSGLWDVPGGRLDEGESLSDGLKREVFEETGLRVQEGTLVYTKEDTAIIKGEQCSIERNYFLVSIEGNSEVVLSQDHEESMWIEPQDQEQYDLIENLRTVFVECFRS